MGLSFRKRVNLSFRNRTQKRVRVKLQVPRIAALTWSSYGRNMTGTRRVHPAKWPVNQFGGDADERQGRTERTVARIHPPVRGAAGPGKGDRGSLGRRGDEGRRAHGRRLLRAFLLQ